ncbi:5007_t:CDS:2, partial [Ambispora gerdemannii]
HWYKSEKMHDLDLDKQSYMINTDAAELHEEIFNLARKAVWSVVEFAEEEQRLAHTRRSPVKQFKSSTESLQIKRKKSGETTQNKCSKCEIVGHYAPTCKK